MASQQVVAQRRPRVGRRALIGMVVGAVAAGALGVLALWWQAPSTRAVANTGDLLVDLGRATGMVAAYLLLVEVALMARVPSFERRIGTDLLVGVHRWIGSYLFGLVVVHVGATVAGYAAGEQVGVWRESGRLLLGYPYVLLAAVALLLLGVVVGLSLRPVRGRLPYEMWHYLHLLAYIAIGLAIGHELVDGLQFAGNRLAAYSWVAAHVAVLVMVLRFRVAEPVRLSLRHGFRVSHVTREPDGSVSVFVTGRHLRAVQVEPGQFFRWRFLTLRTFWEAHPFSLSHVPNARWLRMTAKPVGDHTRALARLRPGVRVLLEGPYGAVTPSLRRGRRIVLVAAGSGIGPLLALAQAAVQQRARVTLVYRVRDAADVCFSAELDALRRTGLVDVHVVTGSRSDPAVLHFLARDLWWRVVRRPRDVDLYLCGPDGFVDEVGWLAEQAGVTRGRIHTESFAW